VRTFRDNLSGPIFKAQEVPSYAEDFRRASKLRKAIVSFVVSVRPHETTRLPLDGFS
jgi:hypothetical protein